MVEPEFYLSLLSSRCRGVSRLSEEQRDTSNPFRKEPDRLVLDVLDTLAAICVSNERGDVFCVLGYGLQWCETVRVHEWICTCQRHCPSSRKNLRSSN